jgi:hypothetical protein
MSILIRPKCQSVRAEVYNLDEFKNNIKKIKNNATENKKIDQLFDYWINFILD